MCAFYSSTETAFGCLNKYKFKVEAEEGNKTAKRILWLYEHFETTLVTVLIGYNVFSVAISTVSTIIFVNFFSFLGMDEVVSLVTSLVISIIVYLFGDTIPKLIARKMPDRTARTSVYPMYFFVGLFLPVSLLFRGISALVKKVFNTKTPPEITEEDFHNVVEAIEEKGDLESNETDIIQASFDFADTKVKEVLTPKSKMTMLDLKGLTREKLHRFLNETNFSRIPCYYENQDKIVGVLVVKNYLNAYLQDRNVALKPLLQKPYFVTPKVNLDDLIDGFRKNKTQIAIVRYEGKLVGMVTTEDCLEELVGRIDERVMEKKEANL